MLMCVCIVIADALGGVQGGCDGCVRQAYSHVDCVSVVFGLLHFSLMVHFLLIHIDSMYCIHVSMYMRALFDPVSSLDEL
jgi:hypothetical protein